MVTINLASPVFYRAGTSGVSAVVGMESSQARIVRYGFMAPEVGASHINLHFTGVYSGDGAMPVKLRCYIGSDPNSHSNAAASSPYTCILTKSNTEFYGQADIILLPSTWYYLWIFPDDFAKYGWAWWPTSDLPALSTSGAAGNTVAATGGTLGSTHTLSVTYYSPDTTCDLKASCGSASIIIASNTAAKSISWTPPLSWAAQNSNGTSVPVKTVCETKRNGKIVVTSATTVSMSIPPSVVPKCTVTIRDPSGILEDLGTYVQQRSKVLVTATASGAYGSKIISTAIQCGQQSVQASSATFTLPDAGTVNITITVVDSRSRKAIARKSITVAAYTEPMISISRVYRCQGNGLADAAGDHACVVYNAAVDKLVASTAKYSVKYRPRSGQWSTKQITSPGVPSVQGRKVILPASPGTAYDYCVVVQDRWTTKSSAYRSVQVAFAILDIDKPNKSVAVGAVAAQKDTFAVGLKTILGAGLLFPALLASAQMQAGENANDYTQPGLYAVDSSQTAQQIANLPTPTAGLLFVFNAIGDSRSSGNYVYVSQLYLPLSPANPSKRRLIRTDGSGRWIFDRWY